MKILENTRAIITLAVVLALLILIAGTVSMCRSRDAEKGRAQTESATGRALDSVARETPIIRRDQEEKKNEVDRIEGSDERLPDGFGADLERVRRGEQRRNP